MKFLFIKLIKWVGSNTPVGRFWPPGRMFAWQIVEFCWVFELHLLLFHICSLESKSSQTDFKVKNKLKLVSQASLTSLIISLPSLI